MNKEIKELRAEFVDTRSISMKMKLESTIKAKVVEIGLLPSETPPQVIRVTSKKLN
ncbi:MAG: FtsL-like putative cell division protein [Lutibacter sp.]